MNRPNRRKVLECGGCDTALERCCLSSVNFNFKGRLSLESGVPRTLSGLPPHSTTQARHQRFKAIMPIVP
jgi:hypothetical protein